MQQLLNQVNNHKIKYLSQSTKFNVSGKKNGKKRKGMDKITPSSRIPGKTKTQTAANGPMNQ